MNLCKHSSLFYSPELTIEGRHQGFLCFSSFSLFLTLLTDAPVVPDINLLLGATHSGQAGQH